MNISDATVFLRRLRDGWLESVGEDCLKSGPFLTDSDISRLSSSTGWTGNHLSTAVIRAFRPFDNESIDKLFVPTRPVRGAGRHLKEIDLFAVLAGRIPALAAKVLFHSIGAGMGVTLKPPSMEPVFTELLVNSALSTDSAVPVSLSSKSRSEIDSSVNSASICLVYGSDATVSKIRNSRRGRPTLTGPHMESFVTVFASSLSSPEEADKIAALIAEDTAIYDQAGCLSPVAVFVQDGGAVSPEGFAKILFRQLLDTDIVAGNYTSDEITPVRFFLQEAEIPGSGEKVFTGPDGIPPAVVFGPRIRPAPGIRTLQVAGFDSPAPDLSRVMPHLSGKIQGLASAGSPGETAWLLRKNPAYRANYVCEPGKLQDPPALWQENGVVLAHELRLICADL